MKSMRLILVIFLLLFSKFIFSQNIEYAKRMTQLLCDENLKGRGYIDNGVNLASNFLADEFHKLGLRTFQNSYFQNYTFSVNTHPGAIICSIDNKPYQVGKDFIVNADANQINATFKLIHFSPQDSVDSFFLIKKIKKGFENNEALVLHLESSRRNKWIDSCKKYQHIPNLILFTEEKKLTHTISTKVSELNSITFLDSLINNKDFISIEYKNQFFPAFENKNIIGYLQGKKKDSFFVFTAHYDHLGMQGNALFPGANDNASGTSMIFYLAEYFSKHKPPCNIIFILFSGEEAGLLGSEYFVSHPTFDLQKIKMLFNLDMMGDASNGITVVNGEVFPEKFKQLQNINNQYHYLPEIKIRGKAKNSDHYYFSEKNIPSFFIYSMGGKGFYHDIYDKAETLSFINYKQVAQLLIDFVNLKSNKK